MKTDPLPASDGPSRHLIFTNGRSGSNYFVQVLNQHPEIANYGEVLGEWTLAGKYIRPRFNEKNDAFLDWLYASKAAFAAGQSFSWLARKRKKKVTHFRRRHQLNTIGVKEFSVNFDRFNLSSYLRERPDIRLITLVRENTMARMLSNELLTLTGTVSRQEHGAGKMGQPKISLELQTLIQKLDVLEKENEAVRQQAESFEGDFFNITYEDYFSLDADAQEAVRGSLLRFLGVSDVPLTSEHRKLRQSSMHETIKNFDDVVRALKGTSYRKWLDE